MIARLLALSLLMTGVLIMVVTLLPMGCCAVVDQLLGTMLLERWAVRQNRALDRLFGWADQLGRQ